MSGHTPGPWSWGEKERGLYGTGEDNEILTHESYEGMWVSYTDHREANMRLIAAAPELLAALIAMSADYKKALAAIARREGPITSQISEAADAAIAKATA